VLGLNATGYAERIIADDVTAIRAHPVGAPLPAGWCLAEAVDDVVPIADGTVMIRRGGVA
jgi:hypothetical protein